ncbi:DUF2730 family protein [Ochrobactrum teleogrylli]|uniref:DUF2730 family protein n=1 Tax=Ochrobactrum teleogrylli TaxID=2479765 RepID=A0ABY2Y7N7_9HYPH|nr:DUF2730 family protein [[Ochrobactrum] teleogrylli]TNV17750.1 DUF2730 family protein [[Ochrobactrum] teleogrylli]
MDHQFLKDWSGVIATLISIGTVIYAWLTAGSRQNSDELKLVSQRLGVVEDGLTEIKAEMKHMPDEKALTDLKLEISEIRGSFGRMEENISSMSRTVHRVEDYLINKGQP